MADFTIDPNAFNFTDAGGGLNFGDNPFGLPADFFDFNPTPDFTGGGAIALGGTGGASEVVNYGGGTGGASTTVPLNGTNGGATGGPVNPSGGTGGSAQPGSPQEANWVRIAGLGIGALTAAFGLAGVIQMLTSGPQTVKQAIARAVTTASPQERQAFNTALQAATTGTQAPAGTPQTVNYGSGSIQLGAPTGAASAIQARQPISAYMSDAGASRLLNTNDQIYGQLASTVPTLTSQIPTLANQQTNMFQQAGAAAPSINPTIAQAIQMQAQGMAEGRLPALDPTVQQRVADVYAGKMTDVDRYVDQSFQGALERGRQQGFAGGPEIFREGTPGTILAPMMAEAARQRGNLAGQQAQTEIQLAAQLPLLASQLEKERIATGVQASSNLSNIGAQMSVPLATRLAGAGNIVAQGGTLAQLLMNAGQQNTTNQLDLARVLLGISGQGQNERLGTATTTQTTQTPAPTMAQAFAPLAQVLGATGGILSGVGSLNSSGVRA